MKRIAKRGLPQTTLTSGTWTLALGKVRLVRPSRSRLLHVDEEWARLRVSPVRASVGHWRWTAIARTGETFGVVDAADSLRTLALWASGGVWEDGAQRLYEVAWIETNPVLSGLLIGCLSLIVARAVEVGCTGLLIPSLPETERIWRGIGAVPPHVAPLRIAHGLVPLVLRGATMDALREIADEARDQA
ncbi:MAG: hypothetical protein JST92_07285 [Deltaproteobacteria bacterium]|nr:hypothetical protein [Deltaproteobacteria bacterium]